MIDKWKKAADSNKVFSAILTNLSKAFDYICHDLLTEKLHAYGLSLPTLKVIQVHLLNQKQKIEIGSSCSTWVNIIFGVPQGSILGLLLLNIFLCGLFFLNMKIVVMLTMQMTPVSILLQTIQHKH